MADTAPFRSSESVWLRHDSNISATSIALERGWLDHAFSGSGLAAHLSLDAPTRHEGYVLCEDSNVPALKARAQYLRKGLGDSTTLLGLTWIDDAQLILARGNSGLDAPIDLKVLKGRVLGVPNAGEAGDIPRAKSLRAYHTILSIAGLTFADVILKDVTADTALWPDQLFTGEADVLYASGNAALNMQRQYNLDVVMNLNRLKDPRHRTNINTPRAIVASRSLVERYPKAVQAYLQSLIRAGLWANTQGL